MENTLRQPYTTKFFVANNNEVIPDYSGKDSKPIINYHFKEDRRSCSKYHFGWQYKEIRAYLNRGRKETCPYYLPHEWQEHQEIERWALSQALGLASTPKQAVLELHGMA